MNATYAPDGRRILTASDDKTARGCGRGHFGALADVVEFGSPYIGREIPSQEVIHVHRQPFRILEVFQQTTRTAVGYVRVSTSMQRDGLSLDAQRATITSYCASNGLRPHQYLSRCRIGARADRRIGGSARQNADVFVILKFRPLSESLRHFCQLYETIFN